jgi:hypothetical protein
MLLLSEPFPVTVLIPLISKSVGKVILMLLFGGRGSVVFISKIRFVTTLIERSYALTET